MPWLKVVEGIDRELTNRSELSRVLSSLQDANARNTDLLGELDYLRRVCCCSLLPGPCRLSYIVAVNVACCDSITRLSCARCHMLRPHSHQFFMSVATNAICCSMEA